MKTPSLEHSSLILKITVFIAATATVSFGLTWIMLRVGLSVWLALPIILVLFLAFGLVFSRKFIAPLAEMRDAAEALTQGDYDVRVKAKASNDEIGQLATSFNVMAGELEHADQMRRDLIANVSHELRTPVSALQALVENMADGVVEPTPTNLEGILGQTHRLSDLIAFLLDLSRVEAGAASLEISTFDFGEFIEDTIEPLEISDAGHNHTINVNIPKGITIEADQNRLRQLFTNIISNALKHSMDGTAILVEGRQDPDEGTIIANVVNYGSQISPEARSDIFRRYVKGVGKPGTSSGGTGLGLSIARWAAGLHGGTVNVVDDTRGADFQVKLPKYHLSDDEK